MNLVTVPERSALEESPAAAAAVGDQLRAAVARRRARPVPPGLLRRRYFYAALPESSRPTPEVRRGSFLGRLLRLALRGFRSGEPRASAPGLGCASSSG